MLTILLLLGCAIFLAPLGKKIGLPVELSYLFIGLILGPSVLNLAGDTAALMHIAELGVVMFLFLIGLELQPSRLLALKKPIFFMGGSQVLITGLVLSACIYALAYLLFNKQLHLSTTLVVGFSFAMSSTAFALQLLTDKKQLNTGHGRRAFAILLFQDLAVIPLLAILPFIGSTQNGSAPQLQHMLLGVCILVGLIAFSRYLFKPFFKYVAQSAIPELFTATALFIVLGMSMLMHNMGLSMALGAFIAGVLLANSEYRHQLEASIVPFKSLLLGLFFISIGLITPIELLLTHPVQIFAAALLLMAIKASVLIAIGYYFSRNALQSLRLGAILAQGGEFAFVVFNAAYTHGVIGKRLVDPLILVVIASIVLTPIIMRLVERVVTHVEQKKPHPPHDDLYEVTNHHPKVIIAGFGRIGQIVSRVLRMHGIPYAAIDLDIKQVEVARQYGHAVYYGYAGNPDVLRAAGIHEARLVVVTLYDMHNATNTIERIRENFPHVKIFARARDRKNFYLLNEAGADRVWRDVYFTSLDMAKHVLLNLGLNEKTVEESIDTFQAYDEKLLAKQQAIFHDEEQLLQSALETSQELANLFESDAKKFPSTVVEQS